MGNASLMHRGAAIMGGLMLLSAFWHARRPMGRLMRLAIPLVMGMVWVLPAQFPSFPNEIEQPVD